METGASFQCRVYLSGIWLSVGKVISNYSVMKSLDTQIKRACNILEGLPEVVNSEKELVFIGNSLGGLVARGVIQMCSIGAKVLLSTYNWLDK